MIDKLTNTVAWPPAPSATQAARPVGTAPSSGVAPPVPASVPQPQTQAELGKAAREINAFIQPAAASIEFSLDDETGRTIVKMIDRETNTVIRQIPNEEVLKIAQALDRLQGLTLRTEA